MLQLSAGHAVDPDGIVVVVGDHRDAGGHVPTQILERLLRTGSGFLAGEVDPAALDCGERDAPTGMRDDDRQPREPCRGRYHGVPVGTRARLGALDHLSVVDEEVLVLVGRRLDDHGRLRIHGGRGRVVVVASPTAITAAISIDLT